MFSQNLIQNPDFVNAGESSNVNDYQLLTTSPAIGAGKLIENNGGRDFFGNPVSDTENPNIGADNGNATSGIFDKNYFQTELFQVYPNIAKENLFLEGFNLKNDVKLTITTLTGRLVLEKHYDFLPQGKIELNISSYKEGVYIISLYAEGKKQSKRFIKRK